jgi:hypothetical protein
VLVGLVAMLVSGWAVNALDLDNGWVYFAAWLVIALGFIGVATVLLVPRAGSQRRSGPTGGAHRQ